ncbi:MAG TPA: winged helix-turn-helix transcriptional regulator [Acidimicrobiales bacterium]
MRPYAQYCPIAKAAEVLGDRWSLLIIREMLTGSRRFNELVRGLPGLSRALLSKRLRQLERAELVERGPDGGYALTEAGEELQPLVFAFGEWGAKWAFTDPTLEELDPNLLLWWVKGRIDRSRMPDRIVVLQFVFTDHPNRYWLVIEPGDVSVCLTDPGFEIDVTITSDLSTMFQVWLGRIPLLEAVRDERVQVDGTPGLVRSFARWFQLSPIAYAVRAASS